MDRIQQGGDFAKTVIQHILIELTDSLKDAVSDKRMPSPSDTWGTLDFSMHGNQCKYTHLLTGQVKRRRMENNSADGALDLVKIEQLQVLIE